MIKKSEAMKYSRIFRELTRSASKNIRPASIKSMIVKGNFCLLNPSLIFAFSFFFSFISSIAGLNYCLDNLVPCKGWKGIFLNQSTKPLKKKLVN